MIAPYEVHSTLIFAQREVFNVCWKFWRNVAISAILFLFILPIIELTWQIALFKIIVTSLAGLVLLTSIFYFEDRAGLLTDQPKKQS